MPLLIEKLVYNSLCLQAANHCPETSVAAFSKNFVHPHQRQSDSTIRKVQGKDNGRSYLYLSIHEIRSNHRVGPALWSFNGGVASHFDIDDLVPISYTENAMGITFGVQFDDHWKLFDISTTDTSDNFPLIESGRIDFDIMLYSELERRNSLGLSEIFMQSS